VSNFNNVPLKSSLEIKVFDQKVNVFGQMGGRRLIGRGLLPLSAIPGTDPLYLWMPLKSESEEGALLHRPASTEIKGRRKPGSQEEGSQEARKKEARRPNQSSLPAPDPHTCSPTLPPPSPLLPPPPPTRPKGKRRSARAWGVAGTSWSPRETSWSSPGCS
jgi:hypothetical protein